MLICTLFTLVLVIRCCQLSHVFAKFWHLCLCKLNYFRIWLYSAGNSTLGNSARCLHDVLSAILNVPAKPLWTHHSYHDRLRGTLSQRPSSKPLRGRNIRPYHATNYTHSTITIRSIVGIIILMMVPKISTATKASLLLCYYLVVSFWRVQTLSLSLLTRNVGGQTKKAVATAMNFIFWAAGNAIGKISQAFSRNFSSYNLPFIGPQLFPLSRWHRDTLWHLQSTLVAMSF